VEGAVVRYRTAGPCLTSSACERPEQRVYAAPRGIYEHQGKS